MEDLNSALLGDLLDTFFKLLAFHGIGTLALEKNPGLELMEFSRN